MEQDLKILGDETPEAVYMRGEHVPEDLAEIVIDWNDETKALLRSGKWESCTVWTASRVILGRYGTWVSLARNPEYR